MAVLHVGFIHGVTLLMSISNLISLNYELISTQHIPIHKKKKKKKKKKKISAQHTNATKDVFYLVLS